MNKKKYLLSGIGVGFIFEILVFLVFLVIIGYREMVMDSVPAVTFIMALVILMLYPTIWGINVLNRLYDGRKNGSLRKRVSHRWAMNAGFVGIIFFSLLMIGLIIHDYLNSNLQSYTTLFSIAICFGVLVYSCVMYIKNYFFLKPKHERIKDLKKSGTLNEGRRYTFLVDEVINENEYKGFMSGEMKVGDFVHLLEAGCEPITARIKKIYSTEEDKTHIVLDGQDDNKPLGKYGVVSSFSPCAIKERIIHAENPRLVAMIKSYGEYAGDNDYTSALVYDACHSNYIVPALVPSNDDHRGEIMDVMDTNQEYSFLSVTANEMGEDDYIMPIFTDWDALEEYKEVMESESAVSVLLSFPEIVYFMRKHRYSGLALNPFGPKPFFFSQEYVNHITSLEGYKEDFIYNNQDEN